MSTTTQTISIPIPTARIPQHPPPKPTPEQLQAALHFVCQYAVKNLPEDWTIEISIRNHEAQMDLFSPNGTTTECVSALSLSADHGIDVLVEGAGKLAGISHSHAPTRDRLYGQFPKEKVSPGEKIVDAIISGGLVRAECPDSPESACLMVWSANVHEQLDQIFSDGFTEPEAP